VVDFLRAGAMSAAAVVDIEALPLRGVTFEARGCGSARWRG